MGRLKAQKKALAKDFKQTKSTRDEKVCIQPSFGCVQVKSRNPPKAFFFPRSFSKRPPHHLKTTFLPRGTEIRGIGPVPYGLDFEEGQEEVPLERSDGMGWGVALDLFGRFFQCN